MRVLREEGRGSFTRAAVLRPYDELLGAADNVERSYRAVRRGETGEEPGVVIERRETLNWLVGDEHDDWDSTSRKPRVTDDPRFADTIRSHGRPRTAR